MRKTFTALGLATLLLPGCGMGGPVDRSARPEARPAPAADAGPRQPGSQSGFNRWVEGFRPRATAQGISPQVFDRAFRNASYMPDVVQRDRNQAEFTRAIWDYLDGAVSATRINTGRAKLAEHARVLQAIEARYGVEKEVVLAVWGMESSYGGFRGTTPIIPALATLAYDGRRGPFFEEQLVAALKIVQAGDIGPEAMTGSWAGAMGHTQFMPTSYLDYAVDFTGDGRRDIWSDDPSDALASAAAYLARFGWTRGQPWGVEVQLPQGFNHALVGTARPVGDWAAQGVRLAGGGAIPNHGNAQLFLPAGARGPAFLTFSNFAVIKRYNSSDSYALGIGHLSDRLRGGGPFRADWPRGDRALSVAERQELQRLLTARGFDTGGVDGRIGPNTLAAVRAYQSAAGLTPDGYVSADLLTRLRRG
ncbi:lytic murein transglycosylase [Plastorhodobacter daqingensis]|uniref:Lytic murein transglycosylase n=1 Tax=Plastorhodobacter daqingensis TaxID=1387281 RepID=A0ABW2UDV4_9RHOB